MCLCIRARVCYGGDGRTSTLTDAIQSAALGKYRATHWLLSHGADPNITNKHGDTALIIAARLNLVPIVRLLLEYGADPTIANKFNVRS